MVNTKFRIILVATIAAGLMWFIDSSVDYLLVDNSSVAEVLFDVSPPHLLMRVVLCVLALLGSLVIGWQFLRQRESNLTLLAVTTENTRLRNAFQQQLVEHAARAESLRKFSYAIEQSPSLVVITDTLGCIEYVNPKFTRVTGYTLNEVLGKNPRILKSGEMPASEYRQLWQTITAGEEWRGLFHNKKKDGELYWESASISAIKNKAGEITHFVAVKEDITQRIEAEQALRESEERFGQVIVSISDHIYVTEITADGRRLNRYLTPHIEVLTGYPSWQFASNWNFWANTVIHPDDRHIGRHQMAELIAGYNSQVEYRLVRADGGVVWVRDSARIKREHTSLLIYGVVSDITKQKQVEAQIRQLNDELEQRVKDRTRELSALYEVTAVGSQSLKLETMLALSLERSLLAMQCQEGYIYLLDYPGDTLKLAAQQKTGVPEADDAAPAPSIYALTNWVLQHGEPLLIPDIDAHFHAGGTNSHTYAGAPIRATGQTIGVLSVIRAITDQFGIEETALLASIADQVGVMVENARLRYQAERAAVMEERERLAHELHDSVTQSLYSLTLLAGGGQRLARAGNLENVETYLGDLGEIGQQALKEMRLLVHELRPTVLEQVGLVGALQQRLDAVEGRSGVQTRLLVETATQLPARIEEGMYRIALEALNNSLKHAAASQVVIKIYANDSFVGLDVTDNGIGFDPATLNDTGGMGLLSLQKRAGQMGGIINITSTPGQGTEVQLRISCQGETNNENRT